MMNLGDFPFGATVTCRFNTLDATGAPITLAGTPAARVRKGTGAGTTITTGVTLTVDVVTGQHVIDIDLSASASYTRGAEYSIELSAGTVSGVSQVGVIVGTRHRNRMQHRVDHRWVNSHLPGTLHDMARGTSATRGCGETRRQ